MARKRDSNQIKGEHEKCQKNVISDSDNAIANLFSSKETENFRFFCEILFFIQKVRICLVEISLFVNFIIRQHVDEL